VTRIRRGPIPSRLRPGIGRGKSGAIVVAGVCVEPGVEHGGDLIFPADALAPDGRLGDVVTLHTGLDGARRPVIEQADAMDAFHQEDIAAAGQRLDVGGGARGGEDRRDSSEISGGPLTGNRCSARRDGRGNRAAIASGHHVDHHR